MPESLASLRKAWFPLEAALANSEETGQSVSEGHSWSVELLTRWGRHLSKIRSELLQKLQLGGESMG